MSKHYKRIRVSLLALFPKVPDDPPENIRAVNSTTESIVLEWDPPTTPNGDITNYSVTWSPDAPSEPIITTATTYNVTDLQPCTIYSVNVSASTSKGKGPPGNIFQSTLPKGKF